MTDRIAYGLLLPPGWERIRVDDTAGARIRDLARQLCADADPSARPAAQVTIETQLRRAADNARRHGGHDLYFPAQPVGGIPLPMSVVVATPPGALPQGGQPKDGLLAFASRRDGAKAKFIDGQLAVRTASTVPPTADEAEMGLRGTRRVNYLALTPDGRYLLVTASIIRLAIDDEKQITDAMEFLFDSVVTTIRFQREPVPA